MKKLKLNLQGSNAEVLTRNQLKQILGGEGGSGGGSEQDAYLCGTRGYSGQCYCDFCDSQTYEPIYCDVPCPLSPCSLP